MRRFAFLATSALLLAGLGAPPSSAGSPASGTTPLASVLTSDGNQFDRNPLDYDIVTEAALAVLAAKPDSPVKVLTDGDTALTAFIPNDRAFKKLWQEFSGKRVNSERKVFGKLASGVGIDTIETVLLYHVVPGATIDAAAALQSDGAVLTTAQGGTFTVNVVRHRFIKLVDADSDDRNPRVIEVDLNAGNKQIAHGISRVLRPVDLP